MAQGLIKWNRGDYVRLGRAVAAFNKKIRELEDTGIEARVPEQQEYTKLKENIKTRSELKKVINSMRRIMNVGQDEVFETEGGERITVWEHNENVINKRQATRMINAKIKELNKPFSQGHSKADMGSVELRAWTAQLQSIRKIEKEKGFNYMRTKLRLDILGRNDYDFVKSLIFQENFMKAMESAKNLEGYDLLMRKLKRYKNPVNFYKLIGKSETLSDIFIYYKEGSGVMYGGFATEQERFNEGLEQLGIVEEEKRRILRSLDRNEKLPKSEKQMLVRFAKEIETADDLFDYKESERKIKKRNRIKKGKKKNM